MKIEFLTQDDPVYILPLFEEFFRLADPAVDVVQVSCCRAMGSRSRVQLAKELFWLYGPLGMARLLARSFAAKTLGALPRRPESRSFYSIAQACASHGIPFQRIENPNSPEFLQELESRGPDLIVSVACPYILKAKLLNFPPKGCINIHHAPLPRYKGMMPTFWQLFHSEKTVGVTIHYMVEKVDDGQALLSEALEVGSKETLHELIRRSKRHGAHCLVRVLRELAASKQTVMPIDRSKSTYFTFPTYDQIQEFRRRGLRVI